MSLFTPEQLAALERFPIPGACSFAIPAPVRNRTITTDGARLIPGESITVTSTGRASPKEVAAVQQALDGSVALKPGDTLTAKIEGGKAVPFVNGIPITGPTAPGRVPMPNNSDFAASHKPRELVAGQLWKDGHGHRQEIGHREHDGWFCVEDGVDGAVFPEETIRLWRYLGTREEVAAREAAPAESDADLRRRCASMGPAIGASAWLERSVAAELGVDPCRVHHCEPTTGTVEVWVDDYRGAQLAPTLKAIGKMLPIWVVLVERPPFAAAPYPAIHAPWTMADCRREIDRALAAEERRGTPFVRAIGAALATLAGDHVEREGSAVPSAARIRAALAAFKAYEDERPGVRVLSVVQTEDATIAAMRAYHEAGGEGAPRLSRAIDRYERERSR